MSLLKTLGVLAREIKKESHELSFHGSSEEGKGTRGSDKGKVPLGAADIVQHCVITLMCVRLVLLNLRVKKERKTEAEHDKSNSFLRWEYTDIEQLHKGILMSGENISEKSFGILEELLEDTQSSWLYCQEMLGKLLDLDIMAIQQFCTGSDCPNEQENLKGIESMNKMGESMDKKNKPPIVFSTDGGEEWAINMSLKYSSSSSTFIDKNESLDSHIFDDFPDSTLGFRGSRQRLLFDVYDTAPTGSLKQQLFGNYGGSNQLKERELCEQSIPMKEEISLGTITPLKNRPLELGKESPVEAHQKLRNVSWEKRSLQVSNSLNIRSLLETLLLEDYGWSDFKLELKETGADLGKTQWIAQAQVTTATGQQKVIARSPLCQRSRIAQQVAIFNAAKSFFPKELEYYTTLRRSDAVPPYIKDTIDGQCNEAVQGVFQRGIDMLVQVMQLLDESDPYMAPFSWSLDLINVEMESGSEMVNQQQGTRRYRAMLFSKSECIVNQYTGNENESAVSVICNLLRSETSRLAGNKGNQLWAEYESHIPRNKFGSSRELSLYFFNSFFGFEPPTGSLLTTVHAETLKKKGSFWKGVGHICIKGKYILISEAYALSKRDAINDTALLACRENFSNILSRLMNGSQKSPVSDLAEMVSEIMERKIITSASEVTT
ncbi:hypothetical protein LSM04_002503 [Trypanosoma melophagium]|uniref:uncharacterized protein n=1 Tax=Trypanosoma melophagium TaxID=715481 RepID=UPI00351A50E6|nr:hypothetical protein LSM04_002503 [Trypanosoma melophagium]